MPPAPTDPRHDGSGAEAALLSIPTDAEIRALHERHAPTREAFDQVYGHSLIVCALAEQLVPRSPVPVDAALVRAGSLLHDIGVYRLYRDGTLDHREYIRHGVLGHDLLREEGLPEELCRFCSCHTGMGVTRDDVTRQGLPIPVADYVPATPEEELVMFADKFHTKSTPPAFVSPATFAARVARFGEDKVTRFENLRATLGDPDLLTLSARYGQRIK
ncbi:HD domain-containing protein [Actinocorallia sp. API 0066]|uniref:HD domain-containing protein n=1 Tax=Actinocorallia sp. API 0066 TaxID=2896846 RepID=UPI001E4DA673|nr:HD domain-containing protein [Actinocorallia sp. API 0066]MCD0451677.1 HD domain-containing protein [Actinocorallia sp. API 0066]